jgi:uncharacterized protein
MAVAARIRGLTTNPAVVRTHLSPWPPGVRLKNGSRACEPVWVPLPGTEVLLLESPGTTSRLVPDAHLAALAIEHGLTLCSINGDFSRFRGVAWENPLAENPTERR